MTKELKVIFAQGCFDDFDGTQEELDELVKEIQRLAKTGEIFNDAVELSHEELTLEEISKNLRQ